MKELVPYLAKKLKIGVDKYSRLVYDQCHRNGNGVAE